MDVKINKNYKKPFDPIPRFVLTQTFMFNDADGYEDRTVEFTENKLEEFKPFIYTLGLCNSAYPCGKGGYDNYEAIFEQHLFFDIECEDIEEFYEEFGLTLEESENMTYEEHMDIFYKIREEKNPNQVCWDMPYQYDCCYQFYGFKLVYLDEKGNEFPCEVTFNEEEKKKFEEIKKTVR